MRYRSIVVVVVSCLALISCGGSSTETSSKAKKESKPIEPVGARSAFQQTFIAARTWAQDLEILRIRNLPLEDVKVPPGKSAVWEVTFVSPGKQRAKAYTWSAVERDPIHEGIFGGQEEAWSGHSGQATSFLPAAFKTDSVEAYEAAAAKSKEYIQKNPDMPLSFLLERTPRHPDPAWRVIWGTSVATSGYSVYVDATSGEYLERMR